MSFRARTATSWKDVPLFSMTPNWSSKEGSALHLPPYCLHMYHSAMYSITLDYPKVFQTCQIEQAAIWKRGWALELIRLSTLLHDVFLLMSTCLMLLFFLSPPSLSLPCLSVLCYRWDCQHFGGRHLREGDAVHWPSQVCVSWCWKNNSYQPLGSYFEDPQ